MARKKQKTKKWTSRDRKQKKKRRTTNKSSPRHRLSKKLKRRQPTTRNNTKKGKANTPVDPDILVAACRSIYEGRYKSVSAYLRDGPHRTRLGRSTFFQHYARYKQKKAAGVKDSYIFSGIRGRPTIEHPAVRAAAEGKLKQVVKSQGNLKKLPHTRAQHVGR